jgi:hypothetical protein
MALRCVLTDNMEGIGIVAVLLLIFVAVTRDPDE